MELYCTECYGAQPAMYIYEGNSLCRICFEDAKKAEVGFEISHGSPLIGAWPFEETTTSYPPDNT